MVVNQNGEIETKPQTQLSGEEGNAAVGKQKTDGGEPTPLSAEHQEFITYNRKLKQGVVMPVLGDPDFCKNMRAFIESRGDGLASSDQLIEAYNLFRENCVEAKKEEQTKSAPKLLEEKKEESSEIGEKPIGKKVDAVNEEEEFDKLNESPIIAQYLNGDKKVSTFEEEMGTRPNKNLSKADTEFKIRKVNKQPLLYFFVILGIAAIAYAVNKNSKNGI
jgi:hypothetical protein